MGFLPSGPEVWVILVIILIVFGAGKLPQVGGALGKGIREFRVSQKQAMEEEEEDEGEEEEAPAAEKKPAATSTAEAGTAETSTAKAPASAAKPAEKETT